jgi:hypothetical protein
MNPFHDDNGRFADGPGGGAVPASRMQRFVTNSNAPDRQQWMARTQPGGNNYHPSVHAAHQRQDSNASTAHEHTRQPVFGKRGN